MSPFKLLIRLGLIGWSTINLGFKKGWVKRKDIFDYAISQLVSGSNIEDVAVIAGGEYLTDDELIGLVLNLIKTTDSAADLDKWRLAFFLCF